MKKTLLATAIAGALGASAAAQAATVYNQDGTQLDIYGNIQIAYANTKNENSNWEDQVLDNGSTIGFSGQHIINPGLTGYFKAEFEHDADEEKVNGGINNGDQAYLGLKGNFGDVRLGSWDPLIDDWTQDPISNNEYFDNTDSTTDLGGLYGNSIVDSVSTDREGDKLQYMSPVWGGLQFAVGTQYKGDAEDEFNSDYGDKNISSNGSNASFFGGVKYAIDAFSVALVYDDLDNYDLTDETTGDQYSLKALGLTAQYTIDTLRLAAKVENSDIDYAGDDGDITRYALGARYGYMLSDNFAGDVYGSYQYIDADKEVASVTNPGSVNAAGDYVGDDAFNEFIVGATYNISPAMYTFVEYANYDRSHGEGDGVAFGAVYSF
ncbi:porin [Salinicola rhizosphaerae]|uniref:Porin n=1 Tax=Salinicola rhizosphaerae TaxID=1443141 RepID=A0ABQ3E7G2_9GAMM|nr:porin [Salinicola rhizosphaerae]GHB24949.1 porin [Salinicola rhizosphaerae]